MTDFGSDWRDYHIRVWDNGDISISADGLSYASICGMAGIQTDFTAHDEEILLNAVFPPLKHDMQGLQSCMNVFGEQDGGNDERDEDGLGM